ncbi:MAG TPA: Hpt domain-containing protein [Chitinophagaceae bacterium]|jgi:HPt (histidine-containing phosphotransfer) domain-containing protein|nr:Hpt domain-containing protein [Chitinophagaceae bacterium]
MPNQAPSQLFIFSDKIDADYIFSMYEDDYPYIETMFKTVLDHFEDDRNTIVVHYKEGQPEALRKSIHKIKPAFGFVGMPAVLELCKNFENKCYLVQSTDELEREYKELLAVLEDAYQVIANEHQKLVSYNRAA